MGQDAPHQVAELLTLTGAFVVAHAVNNSRYFTVKNIHICNTDGSAVTVRVCFVYPGLTPVQGNASLWNFSIPANDFIEWGEGLVLPPNATIQALASSAGVVNLFISGVEKYLFGP